MASLRAVCPRCGGYRTRELARLPQEAHAVFICSLCKHTWCEEGRRAGVARHTTPVAPV